MGTARSRARAVEASPARCLLLAFIAARIGVRFSPHRIVALKVYKPGPSMTDAVKRRCKHLRRFQRPLPAPSARARGAAPLVRSRSGRFFRQLAMSLANQKCRRVRSRTSCSPLSSRRHCDKSMSGPGLYHLTFINTYLRASRPAPGSTPTRRVRRQARTVVVDYAAQRRKGDAVGHLSLLIGDCLGACSVAGPE